MIYVGQNGRAHGFIAGDGYAVDLVHAEWTATIETEGPSWVLNVVQSIVDDLHGRSGLGESLGCVDDDILSEIKTKWTNLIREAIP